MRYYSKFGNKKYTIDGIEFDSKKESQRYCELKMLEKTGKIQDLQTCGKPTPLGVGWIAHLFYSLMCMLLLTLYTYCDIVDVWKINIDIQTQQYL